MDGQATFVVDGIHAAPHQLKPGARSRGVCIVVVQGVGNEQHPPGGAEECRDRVGAVIQVAFAEAGGIADQKKAHAVPSTGPAEAGHR
jgi:hypothetical protein